MIAAHDGSEVAEKIITYMARYDSVDAVLARVRELKIKGWRFETCDCLVARLLRQELGLRSLRFHYSRVTVNGEIVVDLEESNPFRMLAVRFDDKQYPDLIEPTPEISHE